jgi:SpoVK/Ycf46/Vps4 family AAA+-type ATPase
VTLSGILNVIDGVSATEGRLVIMTTNHPETLDPAFYRGKPDISFEQFADWLQRGADKFSCTIDDTKLDEELLQISTCDLVDYVAAAAASGIEVASEVQTTHRRT